MRVGQVFIACCLCFTASPRVAAQERTHSGYHVASIVILPLRITGDAKPETAAVLNDLLASAVHERTRGVRLIDAHEAAALLTSAHGEASEALHCMSLACWAGAGRTAEADSIIVGTLGALHNRHILTLHWVATHKAASLDRHTEVLGDDPSAFPGFTQRAVRALLRRATANPEAEPARPSVSMSTQELCQSEDVSACARGKACDGGDAAACASVARWFEDGVHVARDVGRAVQLYQSACEGGMTSSCAELARLAMAGQGMARNQLRAMALYERSCAGGTPMACAEAADVYSYGLGEIKHDPERARHFYGEAARLYQRQCDGGDAPSCTSLAAFYDYGQILTQNAAHAAALYKRGCELGGASACSNLGELYERGHGVGKDWGVALELFKKGCAMGDTPGCASLSEMVERDTSRAAP